MEGWHARGQRETEVEAEDRGETHPFLEQESDLDLPNLIEALREGAKDLVDDL
jgi:hypothetical protein